MNSERMALEGALVEAELQATVARQFAQRWPGNAKAQERLRVALERVASAKAALDRLKLR